MNQAIKQELLDKLRYLKNKQQVIHNAWTSEDGQGVLELFVEVVPKVVNAHRCSIFLSDPESANVWLQCGTGMQKNQIVIPKHGSNVGEVIATGKHKMVSSMEQRSEVGRKFDSMTGFAPRNMLCVPVKSLSGRRITGAIQVLNKKGRGDFTDKDLVIMERMALHLAMVIENIFLSQEMVEISEQLTEKVGMTEWVIRLWMLLVVGSLVGVAVVVVYFMPTVLSMLQR